MSQNKSKLTLTELTEILIREISIDYITTNMTGQEVQEKYNISPKTWVKIHRRQELAKKREEYKALVLEKDLDLKATKQSRIMNTGLDILEKHQDHLFEKQKKEALSETEIKGVRDNFSIISKEHRLDHNKPTDIAVNAIRLEMPQGMRPIVYGPPKDIEVEAKEIKKSKASEEDSEDDEEDNEIIGNPLG